MRLQQLATKCEAKAGRLDCASLRRPKSLVGAGLLVLGTLITSCNIVDIVLLLILRSAIMP